MNAVRSPTTYDHRDAIFNLYPSLRDAIQPAPLGYSGNAPVSPDQAFSRLQRQVESGTFRFRDGDDGALVGPFLGAGTCLAPLFCIDGDLCWCDPTIEPRPFDLVAVAFSDNTMGKLKGLPLNQGHAEPIAMKILLPYQVKMPRHLRKEMINDHWGTRIPDWLLAERQGFMFLADNHICGVVRRIERNGARLFE